jgi:hypothetical protein
VNGRGRAGESRVDGTRAGAGAGAGAVGVEAAEGVGGVGTGVDACLVGCLAVCYTVLNSDTGVSSKRECCDVG